MKRNISFGRFIVEARKRKNISQKELAQLVKREDGKSISAPYLNDIEHDRRNPPPNYLLTKFAKALDIDPDLLFFRAGRVPEEWRKAQVDDQQIIALCKRVRRELSLIHS